MSQCCLVKFHSIYQFNKNGCKISTDGISHIGKATQFFSWIRRQFLREFMIFLRQNRYYQYKLNQIFVKYLNNRCIRAIIMILRLNEIVFLINYFLAMKKKRNKNIWKKKLSLNFFRLLTRRHDVENMSEGVVY